MGGLIKRRAQLAGEVESIKGTAETLTSAHAKILAYEPTLNFNTTQFKRDPYRKTMSRMYSEPGQKPGEMTFRCELMGPPFANKGTSPTCGNYLRGCGFAENATGGTSTVYTPVSTDWETITVQKMDDGLLKKLCGCMGNVRFIFTVGEPVMCEFTFYGKQSAHSDTALFSPSYPAEKPLIFQNATVTILGDTLILNTLELDMQNTVSMLPKPSDSTGISYGQIVNRDPVITFDPDLELKATHDFLGKLNSTTEAAVSIVMTAADYTTCTFALPKCRYTAIGEADRDGISTMAATLEVNMSSGDDEVTLTFAGTTTSTSTTSTSTTSTSTTSTTSTTA